MDNIIIEKIWQDDSFFEIRVTAQSKLIWATTDLYISDISDLANALMLFPADEKEYYWSSSQSENIEKNLSFRVAKKDNLGHILIEIFMIIQDNDLSNHNCTFFVETEIGMLNYFGKRLLSLNKQLLLTKVALVEFE